MDPAGRRGEIGKVVDVSGMNNDVVTLEFSDGTRAAYMSNTLLVLHLTATLFQDISSNRNMEEGDKRIILRIHQLASKRNYAEALKLAITNNRVMPLCTIDCDDWLLKIEQGRNLQNGRKQ